MATPASEQSVFLQAIGLTSPAGRAAYLDDACRGDPGLRAELDALLAAHHRLGTGAPERDTVTAGGEQFQTAAFGPPPAATGVVIAGKYTLVEAIGEGGMGAVWRARQTEPVRRFVAVKLIKAGMDSKQVLARFEAERQALALMDHPNIATVLDGGLHDGRPYFVMELVKGVPVTEYCDARKLTPRERLELFVPVCQAVQHAHQKGVIHRDLKPSNVLIALYDDKPVVKVIDFGVAKATGAALTERTIDTGFGGVVGTPQYMSPEQATFNNLDIDTRSDVYALGVLLYELLTGSPPFAPKELEKRGVLEILRVVREEEPPRPSTRLSTADALPTLSANRGTEPKKLTGLLRNELDWVVMKALEKDRTRRYDTANGFAADVLRYLADEPVKACPPSAGYRLRKFSRRNKRALATAVVVAAALVAGTAVSAWQAVRATGAERLAGERLAAGTEAERATRAQLLLTRAAEEKATRQLFDARLAQARAGALSRRVGQRFDTLAAVGEATAIARGLDRAEERVLELRNAAIACLALPDLRLARQWAGWPAGSGHVDFDGRLEHYARTDARGAVSIRRVADDAEVAALPPTGVECWTQFTRDGRFLSVHSRAGLQVWRWGGPKPEVVVDLAGRVVQSGDFSPDSRRCAFGFPDGSISDFDLEGGRPERTLPPGTPGASLAIHPDGRRVAVSCPAAVEVRDLDTGAVAATLPLPAAACHLAWHPDGRTLAVVGADARVYLWDATAGRLTRVLDGVRSGGISVAFNPAGSLLATIGWDGRLRLWDPRTGLLVLSTPSRTNAPHRFSPDGRLLAADIRDGNLGLWEVAPCPEYQTLVRTPEPMLGPDYHASVHPGGRLLAVGMTGGVGVWDLAGGRELAAIPLPGHQAALFEGSGALLTNGPAGLFRWPVVTDPQTPGDVRIGPPQKLAAPGSVWNLARSRDDRVLASAQYRGGVVLHADRPDRPLRLAPHDDARYVAVSPDGTLAATSSHGRSGVQVWDTATGTCVKRLPDVGWGVVQFSPDGKWLGATAPDYRLWEVGSWREGPRVGGGSLGAAFSPDSRVLAVETGYGVIRLVDPGSGREFARLEDPNQDRAVCIRFTPDGTQLVAVSDDSRSVHVWDLRAIRRGLDRMKLDWDLPPFPPAERDLVGPLRVVVDPG